jgi:hypothetical protein
MGPVKTNRVKSCLNGKGMEVIKKAVRSSCTGMFVKQ